MRLSLKLLLAAIGLVIVAKSSAYAIDTTAISGAACGGPAKPKFHPIRFSGFGHVGGVPYFDELRFQEHTWDETKEALQIAIKVFDTNHDGVLSREDGGPHVVLITGYSWGAVSAINLAHLLSGRSSKVKSDACLTLFVITVDPVVTGRTDYNRSPPSSVSPGRHSVQQSPTVASRTKYHINVYQRNGLENDTKMFRFISPIFKGAIVEGAVNIDLTEHKFLGRPEIEIGHFLTANVITDTIKEHIIHLSNMMMAELGVPPN